MNWTGLAARVWDPSGGDDPQNDYPYIKKLLEQNPGTALDVGCGTGRLLLRYLKDGLDVEGMDTSADMLVLLREKATAQGLKPPTLYEGYMQELDLPRKYQVIYVPCGTYCLVTDRAQALDTLRRFYEHLNPGGLLVFNLFWPFGKGESLSDTRLAQDKNWNAMWDDEMPDGSGTVSQSMKLIRLDRVEQLLIAKRRYQLYKDGELVREEIFDSNERWYFKYEVIMMLEKFGFRDIQVKGNWTDDDFAEGHESIIYIARK
jgi:ubiquinone/menaquinone biosynthesis C-methylase UbiE